MKLNIGCGYNYLKDFLNIDLDSNSLADRIMEAHDLDVESCLAEEIVASQIIEHLGFFKGKYFLSECFRVLKPNGTLKIETPDIKRSFEIFLKGNAKAKESVLTWIYGAETENMQHRYCFPSELLVAVSKETGFKVFKKEYFYYQENRPSLRLILKKPENSIKNQFFSELRKKLVIKDIPAFSDEIIISEQERLLKELINFSGKDYKKALYLAVYSAEIIKEFFELKILDDRNAMRFFNIAKFLSESNFQGLLLDILKNYKGKAGRQIEVFNYAVTKGISIIKKLLKGERVKIERRGANDMNIFTESSLKTLSSKLFYKGLKEFYLSNYDKALMDFTESSRIYRDNPFNYWNIARIEKLRNNKKHSILNYQKAFSAFESSDISLKRKYMLIHPMANLIRM